MRGAQLDPHRVLTPIFARQQPARWPVKFAIIVRPIKGGRGWRGGYAISPKMR
jgi:hypothetical protein